MMTSTHTPKAETERSDRRSETAPLSQRYGSIGIPAVAAAARYLDRRNTQPQMVDASRIDQRFVESAI